VIQTNHFFNLGYGWLCKHCSAENAKRHGDEVGPKRPRHGTHDGKTEGQRAGLALARWTDATRQSLTCPRCSIEEMVNKT
jgi:hypothetical protein